MKPKHKHAKKPPKGKPPAKVMYFTISFDARPGRPLRPGFVTTV